MKAEKGITLTSLVIYVLVATLLIGITAMISSFFFSNMNLIKDMDKYAPEFNKFSMFFLEDVKKNSGAEVTGGNQVTFADGTIYVYNSSKKAIYRNDTKITEKVEGVVFSSSTEQVSNTTKQIINVKMIVGGEQNSPNGIEYVLKYW